MHILIVEDQFSLADAMKAALEKEKFTVAIAADGEHGEDEALSGVYDLIILDVMLPGKNGFEILHSVKSETDTPVIMVTAKGEIEDNDHGDGKGRDRGQTQRLGARRRRLLRRRRLTMLRPWV